MSAAPKKTKRAVALKKATAAKPVAMKATAAKPVAKKATAPHAASSSTGPVEVCPRCGTTKFAPEERTRWEGRRTVRFTVLVCERGHTFAHPITRGG